MFFTPSRTLWRSDIFIKKLNISMKTGTKGGRGGGKRALKGTPMIEQTDSDD